MRLPVLFKIFFGIGVVTALALAIQRKDGAPALGLALFFCIILAHDWARRRSQSPSPYLSAKSRALVAVLALVLFGTWIATLIAKL
jgi:hypothetical protein